MQGYFDVVSVLISAGADVNAKCNDGINVLNYAAEKGNMKIIELLLARGANNDT